MITETTDVIPVLIFLLTAPLVILYVYKYYYELSRFIKKLANSLGLWRTSSKSPVILSYALETGLFKRVSHGELRGYKYDIYSTGRGVVFRLAFGGNYKTHMVFITGTHNPIADTIYAHVNTNLISYEAEGDFPNYFKVFYEKNEQIDLLSILGPDIMAYLIDYCKIYDIEIYNTDLYITVREDANDVNDPTTLVEDAVKIAARVEPKLKLWSKQRNT